MDRRYTFDALVLTQDTGVQGRIYPVAAVLPIYGPNPLISETEAALLLNMKKALPATKEHIAAMNRYAKGASQIRADQKARAAKARLAGLGEQQATELLGRISDLEQRLSGAAADNETE
ncbi:hypothetical protein [Desulfuromonas thiophila]|uniref:hypothetical protein n=1 Tax=Desulfuromonas thiophila TaxID=57664 RepID=UPI0029F549DB|nr:hypothetical protein [Desulfuromonas thiophila]